MIGSFLNSADSDVGLDAFKIIVGYFKSLTKTMTSSGFWNTLRIYCFRFLLNVLYWSLASFFSNVVPKTVPEYSTSTLKFLINDVYAGRLKRPPLPPRPWWLNLPVQTPWPHPCPPLLEFDLLVSEAQVIVASLPSPPLLSVAGGDISVSIVIALYSFLLIPFWILLNLHSYPPSAWDITPRICSLLTRKWCL